MRYFDCVNVAKAEARKGYTITDTKTNKSFKYGQNPFMDQQIENALFCDMFPSLVPNKNNFFGFDRSKYIVLL